MFGFFVFNTIRRVASELVAAKAADRLMRLPRNRLTRFVTDPASFWIDRETKYRNCQDCYDFIIDESLPEVCDECAKLRAQMLDDDEYFELEQLTDKQYTQLEDDIWAEHLRSLEEAVAVAAAAAAETEVMADASFQQWLREQFPGWTEAQYAQALAGYRVRR